MDSIFYPAVVVADAGRCEVHFVDFPRLLATGPDPAAALTRARERLQEHLLTLTEGGTALPAPTAMNAIPARGQDARPGRERFTTLIEARPPSPSARINITMDEGLLDLVDRAAQDAGLSRSAFLAMASRREIATSRRRRNGVAVMYEGSLERTRRVHEAVQDLGHAVSVRPGAWLLVTDKSRAYVYQALAALAGGEDTLVVAGGNDLNWQAPDDKASVLRVLLDRLETAAPD